MATKTAKPVPKKVLLRTLSGWKILSFSLRREIIDVTTTGDLSRSYRPGRIADLTLVLVPELKAPRSRGRRSRRPGRGR